MPSDQSNPNPTLTQWQSWTSRLVALGHLQLPSADCSERKEKNSSESPPDLNLLCVHGVNVFLLGCSESTPLTQKHRAVQTEPSPHQ